jgi:hypothetical protein
MGSLHISHQPPKLIGGESYNWWSLVVLSTFSNPHLILGDIPLSLWPFRLCFQVERYDRRLSGGTMSNRRTSVEAWLERYLKTTLGLGLFSAAWEYNIH